MWICLDLWVREILECCKYQRLIGYFCGSMEDYIVDSKVDSEIEIEGMGLGVGVEVSCVIFS